MDEKFGDYAAASDSRKKGGGFEMALDAALAKIPAGTPAQSVTAEANEKMQSRNL